MSKPRVDPTFGISSVDVLILTERHPACRRREAQPGCADRRDGGVHRRRVEADRRVGTSGRPSQCVQLARGGAHFAGIHDLHIWPISTTETALTCHLVMPGGHPGDDFLMECCQLLKKSYKIGHATLQIEISESNACALAPDNVVRQVA